MDETHRKRPKGKRRELAPLEDVDARDGPKMLALPTDRHRAFVRALYTVRPGFGARVKAAKLSGWGCPNSSAQSMATIASRLSHDERVLEAIREEDEKYIRSSAPRTIGALSRLIENPRHKDHARGIAMVLDRTHAIESVVNVKLDATPAFKATAEVLARIAELAARAGIDVSKMPPMIDVTPVAKSERVA
jgi:nucleotide-binding universal stress UspA family protein